MDTKIILLVCARPNQAELENALKIALDKERIRHHIVWCTTYAESISFVDGMGFPDFVVTETDTGLSGGGLALLRHIRHVGKTMPVVVWDVGFTQYLAEQIAALSGITVSWGQPNALANLGRLATTLLHGQRRERAS